MAEMTFPDDVVEAAWKILDSRFSTNRGRMGVGFDGDTAEVVEWICEAIVAERERCAEACKAERDRRIEEILRANAVRSI